jgi:hypothetical protein
MPSNERLKFAPRSRLWLATTLVYLSSWLDTLSYMYRSIQKNTSVYTYLGNCEYRCYGTKDYGYAQPKSRAGGLAHGDFGEVPAL